ncbi:carbamoyl phosphate synthase large subunit [Priestia endophytica]
MPKDTTLSTILVIGSGPIVIGQAAEFDYSGAQACLSLKEEGYRVILLNNNPATIMTDSHIADKVYFEPLTVSSVEKIIEKEQPEGLLATLGGQTGLNLALNLDEQGIPEKYGVRLLGTPIESIQKGESREKFRALMKELNEPVPESEIVTTVEEAVAFSEKIDFPLIVRPAYTLGGTGGGIAHTLQDLRTLTESGLRESAISQCLIEKSIAGFKEVEYEVMRDYKNTCITVCNMENIDPVGVHTGDSVVVAPSQTLTDVEYHMLRSASIKIISALGIVGGCNIQFALDPNSKQYYLIEVNPRVSRSSALASKATGYPIAKIAAKLAVGYSLDEILNPVTGTTYASFEPALDYVVTKVPRFPFDKFMEADRSLGTQMKATGEVMAIDRNFERSFQKALYSLEMDNDGMVLPSLAHKSEDELVELILAQTDERLFGIIELLRRGFDGKRIHELTKIDLFFIDHFQNLVQLEKQLTETTLEKVEEDLFKLAKEKGFSDAMLAHVWNTTESIVRAERKEKGIIPSYKMVDTCAAEFASETAYYYSSYFGETETIPSSKKKIAIIGSGPIRIGQGVEFDYSSVHGVLALEKAGYETILINNNPETVSTDFELADRLYFEPLIVEDVLNVLEAEGTMDVIVQYGGQTAISLVDGLTEAGVSILGVGKEVIDALEDRDQFYKLLQKLDIPHIQGEMAANEEELVHKAKQIGFPVLIRPSFVIGGRGMMTIYNEEELEKCLAKVHPTHYPILIDRYLKTTEVEIDAVCDGENVVIPTIVEHVEKAGVHSGDSYAWLPAQSLSEKEKSYIVDYAEKISKEVGYKGIMNIQYIVQDGTVYVLEVNPRASRTVPLVSKVTGVSLISLSTDVLLGKLLTDLCEETGLLSDIPYKVLKFPVFSTTKISGVDPHVGPEMKSTGEGVAIAATAEEAAYKVFKSYLETHDKGTEIYVDSSDIPELLTQKAKEAGVKLITEGDIEDWAKGDSALLFLSLKDVSEGKENRLKALKHGLFVMNELETCFVFLQGYSHQNYTVQSLQEWQNEREEVGA